MTPLGIIGQILLWSGFLGGSYAAVCRLEQSDGAWQTIPWAAYAVCAFVGSVGVVLLRQDRSMQKIRSAAATASLESVRDHLVQASARVTALAGQIDQLSCEEVLPMIDEECAPLLTEFADGRAVILHRFGTAAYAEVMTEFASGERYLNRAWSAAADGYVDEVELSLNAARDFLAAATLSLANATEPTDS